MKYTLVLLFSILFLWNCKNESKDSSPTSNTETPIQENIKPVTEEKSVDYQEYSC